MDVKLYSKKPSESYKCFSVCNFAKHTQKHTWRFSGADKIKYHPPFRLFRYIYTSIVLDPPSQDAALARTTALFSPSHLLLKYATSLDISNYLARFGKRVTFVHILSITSENASISNSRSVIERKVKVEQNK